MPDRKVSQYDATSHLDVLVATEPKQDTIILILGSQYAQKITTDGGNTYAAIAVIGALQSEAVWQCKKINVSGNDTAITWADGNSNFDNIATNLTLLTYS